MTVTEEASGGWLARCPDCKWERFESRRPALDAAIDRHKCPKPKRERGSKATGSSAAAWTDRKDSTWIDKL